ncbi:hypothetical protein LSM04_007465 [Trypanosoma melophagium]|uniref:uncharacterized protein n=1 Tax=Trypanosoma melophagium TaxID=715481 RepID=UPI00351A724C|nr:hypothetical protein LSM04_007465 [Trypanosoma melophagium]
MDVKRDETNPSNLPSAGSEFFMDLLAKDNSCRDSPNIHLDQQDSTNDITNREGFSQRLEREAYRSAPDVVSRDCSSVTSIAPPHSERDDVSHCTGTGNEQQYSAELASLASVPIVGYAETCNSPASTKHMVVNFWRRRNHVSRFLPLGLSGDEKGRNPVDSTGPLRSIISSQRQCEHSSDEWNFQRKSSEESAISFSFAEEGKGRVEVDSDLYTNEANSCAIIISLLQGIPRELLRSRYFHTWWRCIFRMHEQKRGNHIPVMAISSVAENVPAKPSTTPITGLASTFSPVPVPSLTPPSRTPGGLAAPDSLDVSWQLTTCEDSAMLTAPAPVTVSGVKEPDSVSTFVKSGMSLPLSSSGETRPVVSTDTIKRPKLLIFPISRAPSDVFLERPGRRQDAQESPMCLSSGLNQRVSRSSSGSRREQSARSQEMLYVFYFNMLEDEEAAARIVLEQKENGVRRTIQSHANRVLDEALMLALCGKRPASLPLLLRVQPVENNTMRSLSACSDDQQDFTPRDLRSTKSMPSFLSTQNPIVMQVNGGKEQEKQESQKDEKKETEQQTLVEETLPTPDNSNLLQFSNNSLTSLHESFHQVGVKEMHISSIEERSFDNNHNIEAEFCPSLFEITRNSLISPSLDAFTPPKDPEIQIDDGTNNKTNTNINIRSNSTSIIDNKDKSDAKKNLNDAGSTITDYLPISYQLLLSRVRYAEFSERERERRCRILVKYRKGLEEIITICFGGSDSKSTTKDPPAVKSGVKK